MNTPISWIKAYVPDLDCSVQEYVDRMTLSGSHVENAVYLDKNLEKIVVGQVQEAHPLCHILRIVGWCDETRMFHLRLLSVAESTTQRGHP